MAATAAKICGRHAEKLLDVQMDELQVGNKGVCCPEHYSCDYGYILHF